MDETNKTSSVSRRDFLKTGLGVTAAGLAPLSAAGFKETVAERLGYPKDAKLLIVHGDDLGVAHSADRASFYALEHHDVSAASVMVPCPWLTEVVAYARQHPEADIGLHLTLNNEWDTYRWGPIAPRDRVPSLLDPDNYLWHETTETVQHGRADEVEREIRAQVEQALRMGLHPTHLDDHMVTLESRKDFYAALVKVGHDYHLPFRAVRPYLEKRGWLSMLSPNDIVLDQFLEPNYHVPPDQWADSYFRMLDRVQPGLNEMIVHLGYDDAELEAITVNHTGWGAAWRQRDFNLVTSPAFKEALRKRRITVIGWRELGKLAR
ncbi:MAG: ChbG/HpnK family deacetylase [Terriglobia bacterium]